MTATIIPFPKQPAAALIDRYRDPQVIQCCHEDGMPVRRGDRVWLTVGTNTIAGTVSCLGMISELTRMRTYSIQCDDGVVRTRYSNQLLPLTRAEKIKGAQICQDHHLTTGGAA